MIWMSRQLAMQTKKIEILPKVLSGHNQIIWINKTLKGKKFTGD